MLKIIDELNSKTMCISGEHRFSQSEMQNAGSVYLDDELLVAFINTNEMSANAAAVRFIDTISDLLLISETDKTFIYSITIEPSLFYKISRKEIEKAFLNLA